mgnify:CR=1 FL=1
MDLVSLFFDLLALVHIHGREAHGLCLALYGLGETPPNDKVLWDAGSLVVDDIHLESQRLGRACIDVLATILVLFVDMDVPVRVPPQLPGAIVRVDGGVALPHNLL